MARARPVEGLEAEHSYAEAAAMVAGLRAEEATEHAARALDVTDIEGVHDMRVATRRLRAALEIFEPCFPQTDFRTLLGDVKSLADALGERRDRDVTIAALRDFAERVPAPDRPGIRSLIDRLGAEQTAANAELEPYVAPQRLAEMTEKVGELIEAARR